MRNYVFGQTRLIALNLEEPISSSDFYLFFIAKYSRIVQALTGLISGGSFYIYRQAVVKQAIGKFAGTLGPIKEVEIDDIQSAAYHDVENEQTSRLLK